MARYKPRTYVVSDIHGYGDILYEKLKQISFYPKDDHLIILGDIADGGNQLKKVVETFEMIDKKTFVLGNHDLFLKRYLFEGHVPLEWMQMGGMDTIQQIQEHGLKDRLKELFGKAKHYHIDGNQMFIHGGFNHKKPFFSQKSETFCYNRKLLSHVKQMNNQGKKLTALGVDNVSEFFFGHSPFKNAPVCMSNCWFIDAGVKTTHRLCVMDVHRKEWVT